MRTVDGGAENRLRASSTEGVDTPYVWTGAHL